MGEVNDGNATVIEESRANQGRAGGPFEASPIRLLHTTGAKSGLERVSPLTQLEENDRVFALASKAGADTDPDWF